MWHLLILFFFTPLLIHELCIIWTVVSKFFFSSFFVGLFSFPSYFEHWESNVLWHFKSGRISCGVNFICLFLENIFTLTFSLFSVKGVSMGWTLCHHFHVAKQGTIVFCLPLSLSFYWLNHAVSSIPYCQAEEIVLRLPNWDKFATV